MIQYECYSTESLVVQTEQRLQGDDEDVVKSKEEELQMPFQITS